MRCLTIIAAAVLLTLPGTLAHAQEPAPNDSKYVSREEYEKLLKEMQGMRAEMETLRKERAAAPVSGKSITQADLDQAMDDVDKQVKVLKDAVERTRLGMTNIFIAGDMSIDFVAREGSPSTFEAGIAPLILYKLSDRLLIEAAADIGISTDDTNTSETSFELTIANASYILNKYVTVGGGLFVVPFGVFHNHYDPPWMNKLPDEPLPFGDNAIAPGSEVGIFAEGAIPVSFGNKVTYAAYVTNGPNLNTSGDAAGSLNFDDFTDLNNGKAVGGRISYMPNRFLEVGYSIMSAAVSPQGFKGVDALIQGVDFEYRKEYACIGGTFDFRSEWVWSQVGEISYPDTTPSRFDNDRNGGYVQVAYRPTRSDIKYIRNLEPVFRYDRLDVPQDTPGGGWEQRYTMGLNYWLMPNAVLKFAYEFDDVQQGEDHDAVLFQFGLGL